MVNATRKPVSLYSRPNAFTEQQQRTSREQTSVRNGAGAVHQHDGKEGHSLCKGFHVELECSLVVEVTVPAAVIAIWCQNHEALMSWFVVQRECMAAIVYDHMYQRNEY